MEIAGCHGGIELKRTRMLVRFTAQYQEVHQHSTSGVHYPYAD